MRNSIKSLKVVRFLSVLLCSMMLIVSNKSTIFAAEFDNSKAVIGNDVQAINGSLSGYGHKYDSNTGSFTFSVSGSWSPYAGCTIKTEGFSSSSRIVVSVYDSSGSSKTSQTLGANDAKENIAIFNVSPGTYTVKYSIANPSSGTIHVWIY